MGLQSSGIPRAYAPVDLSDIFANTPGASAAIPQAAKKVPEPYKPAAVPIPKGEDEKFNSMANYGYSGDGNPESTFELKRAVLNGEIEPNEYEDIVEQRKQAYDSLGTEIDLWNNINTTIEADDSGYTRSAKAGNQYFKDFKDYSNGKGRAINGIMMFDYDADKFEAIIEEYPNALDAAMANEDGTYSIPSSYVTAIATEMYESDQIVKKDWQKGLSEIDIPTETVTNKTETDEGSMYVTVGNKRVSIRRKDLELNIGNYLFKNGMPKDGDFSNAVLTSEGADAFESSTYDEDGMWGMLSDEDKKKHGIAMMEKTVNSKLASYSGERADSYTFQVPAGDNGNGWGDRLKKVTALETQVSSGDYENQEIIKLTDANGKQEIGGVGVGMKENITLPSSMDGLAITEVFLGSDKKYYVRGQNKADLVEELINSGVTDDDPDFDNKLIELLKSKKELPWKLATDAERTQVTNALELKNEDELNELIRRATGTYEEKTEETETEDDDAFDPNAHGSGK